MLTSGFVNEVQFSCALVIVVLIIASFLFRAANPNEHSFRAWKVVAYLIVSRKALRICILCMAFDNLMHSKWICNISVSTVCNRDVDRQWEETKAM